MSTQRIYMSGSTRVHKHSRCPCMPEYGSESQTLHIYACVCICEACERYLSMELSVMKIIGVDFIVVWIFCSFNDVFISSYTFKMFLKLIGLLSNYHNRSHNSPKELEPDIYQWCSLNDRSVIVKGIVAYLKLWSHACMWQLLY